MAFLFNWETMEPSEYAITAPSGSVVQLGERNYLRIDGEGDESSETFQNQAAAMLAVGEYLSNAPQHNIEISGQRNFVHYPLLVSWFGELGASHQRYQMRMKQPNFMTKTAVAAAIQQLQEQVPLVASINYERFEEGLEAQVGHTGVATLSTVTQLQEFVGISPFAIDNAEGWHRELYLNDITTLPQNQWKIILRQRVSVENRSAASDYSAIVN